MLHLVAERVLTQEVSERVAAGDAVLLQNGSLWAAFAGHRDNANVQALLARSCKVCLLQEQLAAAGIEPGQLLPGVLAIDYAQMVDLTLEHAVCHTWC